MLCIHVLSILAVVVYGAIAVVVENEGLSICFVFLAIYSALQWVTAYFVMSRYKEQCNVYSK